MTEPSVPTASASRPAAGAPSTFLFTDIEGSTRLWEEHAAAMGVALAQHDRILRSAIEDHGGTVIKTTGDGILAIFGDANAAMDAALAGQRHLRDAAWADTGPLRVRMALHAGTAESRDGDYFGPALNRVARILAIGHGRQVLASAVAAVLARDGLPAEVELRDMGSHRLRDLDRPEQVFQVQAPDLPSEFPALRSQTTRRTNLPVQLTSFVGRETELAELRDLLGRHRLVTLIGVGGTGKTRLMLEAASRSADRYPDGVWLAELAPLSDAGQIPSEISRALGAPEVPGAPALATVSSFLSDKEVLLLLDNAEHLVEGVAGIAGRLLGAAPGLRILATSREALALPGEAVVQLQSLSCPVFDPGRRGPLDAGDLDVDAALATEAVRLFADRAAAVDPAFTVTHENLGAVSEICRRLDGIPLAVELAAARVSAMTPADIARGLGDRFRLLAGGRRTAVPRQQTLHALVDWSWDLLTEDDRRLLRRLAVFAGGWTTAMAARVVGDAAVPMNELELLDGLMRLVDRSLVQFERGATPRYRMLETIRQYAREKLIAEGEVVAYADRHFEAFARLADEAAGPLRGPRMVDWLDRLDAERENLVSALEWGLESEPWQAIRMATALTGYWSVRVMSEDDDARLVSAIEIARREIAEGAVDDPERIGLVASLLGESSRIWAMSGRSAVALPWAREAMELADRSGLQRARLFALGGMGVSSVFSGLAGPAGRDVRPYFAEASDLAERTGEWWILALASGFSGASMGRFEPEAGMALVQRGLAAAERSANPYILGAIAIAHGRMLGVVGDLDGAVASFRISVDRFMELGDERFVLAARSDMAHALRRGGHLDEALGLYDEVIGGWIHLGHRGAVANVLENFAYIACERGDAVRAARLLGAAEALRAASGSAMAFDEEPERQEFGERVAAALGPAAAAAERATGMAMSQRDAVAYARSRDDAGG